MISETDVTQTVEMNELFSPAGLASQVLWRSNNIILVSNAFKNL